MPDTSVLHPMIVHFPIALILAAFLADLLAITMSKDACYSRTALYLMLTGALGAAAAFISGKLFTEEPSEGAIVGIFSQHETMALVTLVVILIGAALRFYAVLQKKDGGMWRWIIFGFSAVGAISVAITGHLGGTMVYEYMMGL